jgi:predicted nucleic acid-binding protein
MLADSSRIVLEPLDAAIAEVAAIVIAASRDRVSTTDAIHIATAFVIGADAILTNDEAWRGIVAGLDEAALRQIAGDKKRGAPRRPEVLLIDELLFEFD